MCFKFCRRIKIFKMNKIYTNDTNDIILDIDSKILYCRICNTTEDIKRNYCSKPSHKVCSACFYKIKLFHDKRGCVFCYNTTG
jgi:hypothetical protein